MTISRSIFVFAGVVAVATAVQLGCNEPISTSPGSTAAAEGDSQAKPANAAVADAFTLPKDGSIAEYRDFIDQVANPQDQFADEAAVKVYKAKAVRAINAAADRIIAKGENSEDYGFGIGWKLAAFRMAGELGDTKVDADAKKYIDRLTQDKRPAVRAAAVRERFKSNYEGWQKQSEEQRLANLKEYVSAIKANGLELADAQLLEGYSDLCSQGFFATSAAAAGPFRELLPLVKSSQEPKIAENADKFAAMIRRLELPGGQVEMEGKLFDGGELDWKSYRGKVVLVDFWASDCSECIIEIPNLVRLYRAYHDKGFEILGVNLDHDRKTVQDIIDKSKITWPQVFDENPSAGHWEHALSTKYAIDALPRMLLIDKDGKVVHTNARGTNLTEELKKLLGEPAVALDDEIPKTVPDGSAAEIMVFMEDTLRKLPPPKSQQDGLNNLEKIRTLLGVAGEKILAGEPTVDQASEAIQMRLASLRPSSVAPGGQTKEQGDFLKSLESIKTPAVAGALAEYRLMQTLSDWEDLPAGERTAAVERYLPFAREVKPSLDQIRLVNNLAIMSSFTGDMALTKRLVDAYLPAFKASEDPAIAKLAVQLEGIGRRSDLPGNMLQMEGTFLDGTKLDWESYRGKVVLVDFWASWCKPCLEEIPNIMRNYHTFHDQGFEVIGVSLDDERQAAKAAIDQIGIPWQTLFGGPNGETGFDSPLAIHYGIISIPVTVLVGKDGKVVTTMARGPLLEQHLKKLLNK